jgi:hypothetical protein
MKKFIQICSLFSLLVLSMVVSASAQRSFGTDVEIPFAFNVADRSYEAGNYIVKLEKISSGAATLSIQDTKTDKMQTVLLNMNGDGPGGEIKLVFDTIEGRRYLTKVRTAERTFALVRSRSEKSVTKAGIVEKPTETSVIGGTADLF